MAGNWQWSADITSGVSRNHALSDALRYASIAETLAVQFAKPESGFGAHMGDTVTIQRIRNTAEPDSAVLSQSGKVPIDQMAMSTRSITVSEFGRGLGFTRLSQLLNHFDTEDAMQKTLKKQMKLTIDTVAFTAMKACQIFAAPATSSSLTFTTNGTTSTGSVNMSVDHVKLIRDYLRKTIHCEPYQANTWICLASTKACRGVKDDPQFSDWRRYIQPNMAWYNGELGMIENIRFIEVDHDNALTEVGSGSVVGEAIFFGDDVLAVAEVEAPELLVGVPGDFGRQRSIAWYGVLGFSNVWGDSASDGEARSVYFTAT